MKIAVTGAAGLLGRGLVQTFQPSETVTALTRNDADITDAVRMREVLSAAAPDVIVHAAAMPDIDDCERRPEEAFRVNAEATGELVKIARDIGAEFAFISTDAVFDGKNDRPYIESDPVNPPSVYGKTKVAAEEYVRKYSRHFIFRVSVLFGPGKANFVNKGWCKAMGNEAYPVASDQLGSATYTLDAAKAMLQVMEADAFGTYHVCNQGACTRYELAKKSIGMAGLNTDVVVAKTIAEMARVGPRLKYSVMDMRALGERGFEIPRRWEDALAEYVRSLGPASQR